MEQEVQISTNVKYVGAGVNFECKESGYKINDYQEWNSHNNSVHGAMTLRIILDDAMKIS